MIVQVDIVDEPGSVRLVSQADTSSAVEPIEASTRFVQLMIRVAERMNQRVANIFVKSEGLKAVEVRILLSLAREQPRGVGHISRRTRLDKAWISRTLRALEARGLVSIADGEERTRLISLTAEGNAVAMRIIPVLTREWAQAVRGIDARLGADMLMTVLGNIERS